MSDTDKCRFCGNLPASAQARQKPGTSPVSSFRTVSAGGSDYNSCGECADKIDKVTFECASGLARINGQAAIRRSKGVWT